VCLWLNMQCCVYVMNIRPQTAALGNIRCTTLPSVRRISPRLYDLHKYYSTTLRPWEAWGVTIVTVTKLHASRPRKDYTPLIAQLLSPQYSVGSFATLQVLSCLHSSDLCCSCCNGLWFLCDLEACNLVAATIVIERYPLQRAWLHNLGHEPCNTST
jgi:hypothetical protein